jgi:pyrimidine operon attenuation protein/uracil phosphoribosyltransferase
MKQTPSQGGDSRVVLDAAALQRTLVRIAHEIVERNPDGEVALVGIHRRGVPLAARLRQILSEITTRRVSIGELDIAFYRDDFATQEAPEVRASHVPFRLEGHSVVLVDDVMYTGRTVRAAIGALFDYGRPARVQLAVVVDRGHRELPLRPDYVGRNLPTATSERVTVHVSEIDGVDEVRVETRRRA